MMKSIKYLLLTALMAPLLLTGCDDLFDKGDVEKTYSGPDKVAFQYLENEITEGESHTLTVQFISSKGEAPSDVSVNLSASSTNNYDAYSLSSSTITIPAGETSATVTVSTSDDQDLATGDEAQVNVTISGAQGAEVASNLKTSTIYVTGQ